MTDWLKLLSPAFEEMSNPIAILEAEGGTASMVYVNRAFENITGYRKLEGLGQALDLLEGEGTDPDSQGKIRAAIESNSACHAVVRHYRRDGSTFLNELRMFPTSRGSDAKKRFVLVFRDVTSRFVALALQRRIQAPSHLLGELETFSIPGLDFSPDLEHLQLGLESAGVLVTSTQGLILYQDPIAEQILASGSADSDPPTVFGLFESSGLIEAFRPSEPASSRWISAYLRGTTPQILVLLRAHRVELTEGKGDVMVLLLRVGVR